MKDKYVVLRYFYSDSEDYKDLFPFLNDYTMSDPFDTMEEARAKVEEFMEDVKDDWDEEDRLDRCHPDTGKADWLPRPCLVKMHIAQIKEVCLNLPTKSDIRNLLNEKG